MWLEEGRRGKKKKMKPWVCVPKIATHRRGRRKNRVHSTQMRAGACARRRRSRDTRLRLPPRAQVQWWPPLQPPLPPVTSDPRGRIHHLLGSPGASQLPPQGIQPAMGGESPGWSSSHHHHHPQPRRQLCLETDRGAAQMWESGADRRYMVAFSRGHVCYSTFSWEEEGGSPLIWPTAKHLAFCSGDE